MSREAMTADVVLLPHEALKVLVDTIMEHHNIDIVLYDCTNKPPATIERE